jgi:transcriptional regulator with XRE-family HTH domain
MTKNGTGFGAWLASMLREHNITQTAFADMCNVHRSAVHHWMNDKRIPQRNTLVSIADALATITGEHKDDVKAELLWQTQISIEAKQETEQ